MATRSTRTPLGNDRAPSLKASPETYLFPYKIQLIGTGWSPCPVVFLLDGEQPVTPAIVLRGEASGAAVRPVAGEFLLMLNLPGLRAGRHRILAVAKTRGRRVQQATEFVLERVPESEKDGRPTHRWFRRREHFLKERFPDGVNRRPGSRLRALAHRDAMRASGRKFDPDQPSPPVSPGANWYCIGPSVVRRGQVFGTTPSTYTTAPISGRITSIAYDSLDTNVVYVGAAQGGVWKSTDGGLNWRPKSDYAASLAIGCVTVDPSVTVGGKSMRILAGTGEPNESDSYYGAGMLLSTDGGETWVARGTATFARAAFSTIAVDPANNLHLYAATDTGVYESTDAGINWTQIETGVCYDLVVDWTNPSMPELYVGKSGFGVRRSTDGGVTWTTLSGGLPVSGGRVALAKAPSDANALYAAFVSGSSLTGIYRTTDGGATWTVTASTPAGVAQAGYNLVLGVHPTDPNTVLFGDVHLWRTTNGGGAWTRVSTGSPGIHADQHAIAFHPTNGSLVFVGNDGGVFYSMDGGVTYAHRNKDLATLQYFICANHSLWDAVMLGGTQDNGAQRYLGHPAWEHSALGDGAYAAINSTTDTRRWFESRWWGFPLFRSDSAGAPGTWVDKKGTVSTNSNWFYPPFEMDPADSRVLFVGYERLWRTTNSGDTWTAITGTLVGAATNITAIAVAPSDSNTVYVGMQNGNVFRVTQSGGTWTATDVTSAPLPAGQISDIAIHPTNASIVYVTTSNLIFSEGVGEFTNDHVFRTTDGGTTWVNRSTGLAQANPVNAIAIDPANPDTIYIGCDVGIFRSSNGGGAWAAWDDGLPNCSVQDLKFFAPRRLLRAATHGRSIWERPVDAAAIPLTDIYLRDDVLDTGLATPGPSGVEHPFNAGETVYWYQSPDIKIDAPDPVTNAYQTPSRDIDYVQFEELVPDNPRRDTWVRAHVQVHNRGNNPATNVQVRTFWANAGGGLPNLPADFWTAFPNTDPSDTSVWHPVGAARTLDIIYPGQPRVTSWSWLVPGSAPTHSCMLAVARSDENGLATSSLVIATAVNGDNNVTLKNLHVDNVLPGSTGADEGAGPYYIDFAAYSRRETLDIRINPGTLPRGTRVQIFFPDFKTRLPIEKSVLGLSIRARKRMKLPERPEEACGDPTLYRTDRAFILEVGRRARRDAGHPGVMGIVPGGDPFSAAMFVNLPKNTRAGTSYVFYVEHWSAGRLVGGSEYELRVGERGKERR
jgi:photosystem II stability/assembly factor-like uncharacterized protein